jgi:hypothetical protein
MGMARAQNQHMRDELCSIYMVRRNQSEANLENELLLLKREGERERGEEKQPAGGSSHQLGRLERPDCALNRRLGLRLGDHLGHHPLVFRVQIGRHLQLVLRQR